MVGIDGSVVSISYDTLTSLKRSSAYCRPSLEMAFDNMFIFDVILTVLVTNVLCILNWVTSISAIVCAR